MCRFPHLVCVFVSLSLAATYAYADPAAEREDQFKAAYVFNFVKFVEWPAAAVSDTLTVCFRGGEGVYRALATGIENKRVGGRQLVARQLAVTSSPDKCDVLYADAATAGSPPTAYETPMLTISDAKHFVAHGGMIELFTERHRLRFLINVASAHKAGLRISSDLLKLAAGVQREAR